MVPCRMGLVFHWRLPKGGETSGESRASGETLARTGLPDLDRQSHFCRTAEQLGLQGVLIDIGAANPDPLLLAAGLGPLTESIEFIVACRSGLWHPTTFVQQLNTLSVLVGGRVSVNVVAGHSPVEQAFYGDFLEHDQRYDRTEEFLALCHALWRREDAVDHAGRYYEVRGARLNTPFAGERGSPYLFIAGGSAAAQDVAIRQGSCWMRLADTPTQIAEDARPVLAAGKQVGLRMSTICRPTHARAVAAARELVHETDAQRDQGAEAKFVQDSDSISIRAAFRLAEHEWLTPTLWTGAVRSHGAPAMSLVGSPREIADALLEYGRAGVSQFILSGWPKLDEMIVFGREVLPLIREAEQAR
jgi:alkanesulfonate monooxygenase